jgi:hypothetical protein
VILDRSNCNFVTAGAPSRLSIDAAPPCGHLASMQNYRRLYMPGGTYFFTVNLRRPDSRLFVEDIGNLRAAYSKV